MHLENWAAHGRRRRRVYQAARGPNGLGIGLAVDGAVGRCLALRCRGAFGDPICTGSSSEDQVHPPGRVEIAGVPVNLDSARGRSTVSKFPRGSRVLRASGLRELA